MVCRDPPAGRARWTDRLITEEAVKCPLVPQVGRETIRLLLLDHDLQPWREKMGGVPEREQDYLHKREDVLAT
jgi:putative transposase